ncbi:MAG: zinc-dependent alcohol dehydrogenase family protein [Anaerolineae bacterium]
MKAIAYDEFKQPPDVRQLPDPSPPDHGAVIRVTATGLCRSDWHGWMGHDPDINRFPHVPGHEFAGVVEAVGRGVRRWRPGQRVTVPFVCACGDCPQCAGGHHQVCDRQLQPGFHHWGSFAEYVAINYADVNLVALPDTLDDVTAASLGCRFATSFRGVVDQGRVSAGEWVAVHGCGGVGLSAVMIAAALGANVVAVDITAEKLALAREVGATATVNAAETGDVVAAVRELTGGGVHLSVDALGSQQTCFNSVANLRKRGRHVQIGLMAGQHSRPVLPMGQVIGNELEIFGSHGMQAHRYPAMLAMIAAGKLQPQKLIGRTLSLSEAAAELPRMDSFGDVGVAVINKF